MGRLQTIVFHVHRQCAALNILLGIGLHKWNSFFVCVRVQDRSCNRIENYLGARYAAIVIPRQHFFLASSTLAMQRELICKLHLTTVPQPVGVSKLFRGPWPCCSSISLASTRVKTESSESRAGHAKLASMTPLVERTLSTMLWGKHQQLFFRLVAPLFHTSSWRARWSGYTSCRHAASFLRARRDASLQLISSPPRALLAASKAATSHLFTAYG